MTSSSPASPLVTSTSVPSPTPVAIVRLPTTPLCTTNTTGASPSFETASPAVRIAPGWRSTPSSTRAYMPGLSGAHGGAGIEVARRDVPGERREDAGVVEAGLGDLEERTGPVHVRPREDHLAPLGLDLAHRSGPLGLGGGERCLGGLRVCPRVVPVHRRDQPAAVEVFEPRGVPCVVVRDALRLDEVRLLVDDVGLRGFQS